MKAGKEQEIESDEAKKYNVDRKYMVKHKGNGKHKEALSYTRRPQSNSSSKNQKRKE